MIAALIEGLALLVFFGLFFALPALIALWRERDDG